MAAMWVLSEIRSLQIRNVAVKRTTFVLCRSGDNMCSLMQTTQVPTLTSIHYFEKRMGVKYEGLAEKDANPI